MATSQSNFGSGPTLPVGKVSVAQGNSKPNLPALSGSSDQPQALTADSRKNDNLLQTKSQKNVSIKSKEIVRPDNTDKIPKTVEAQSHRSLSLSSAGSRKLRRCLSKVMFNIIHARDHPLRAKKPDPPKRVLPAVPDPDRTAPHPDGKGKSEPVKLVCRVRPTTQFAKAMLVVKDQAVEVLSDASSVASNKVLSVWTFPTDKALYGGTQQEVYQEVLHAPVLRALDGVSGLVVLCGRKRTGKTYTSCGEAKSYEYRGLIPRALQQIYGEVQARQHEYDIRISISHYDLVGEVMVDLLAERCQSDMTECSYRTVSYVKELAYARANSEDEALFLFFLANYNRRRIRQMSAEKPVESHTFFTLYFEIHSKLLTQETFKVSKLTILELASATNFKEFPQIIPSLHDVLLTTNKSLALLEKTMSLRLTGDIPLKKIPCRQSKLVYALKDILADDTRPITIVACVSGEKQHLSETVKCLKFASRCKGLPVYPRANLQSDQRALLHITRDQADRLKTELRMYDLLNGRESPDYVGHADGHDLFRTARQVKDFVDGHTGVPKFTTYRQLESFLAVLKKFAKDGDLPVEPVDIPDQVPGRETFQLTVNETDDGKVTPAKDGLDVDGTGDLEEKDGMGVGVAPAGMKGKNIKNLMKKKKDEKPTLKVTEKASVINTKKQPVLATAKKTDKIGPANSPLKDHLSDSGRPVDPTPRPEAVKPDESPSGKAGTAAEVTPGLTLGPFGNVALAGGAATGGQMAQMLLKAIPKPQAFQLFTTKIPIGMELFRVSESQRQMVATQEKSLVTLATAVNNWIDEMDVEQYRLVKLAEDRARTRPQTTAEIPVLSFEEYKMTSKIKHLRYLIETGHSDIATCQKDLTSLRETLAESRNTLLASFEDWYARTYEEAWCETPPASKSAPVTGKDHAGSLPGAATTTVQPNPISHHQTGSLPGLLPEGNNNPNCLPKVAPRDAMELHRIERKRFLDSNPEAGTFYRVRDRVRDIVKVREENEAYHRLNPWIPLRKLDPELTITHLVMDLPTSLHRTGSDQALAKI